MEDATVVKVLKALADPKRFRMIQEIASAGELNCTQVMERFHLSQPAISHHLKILKDVGLLLVRQEAQLHYISVNHDLLDQLIDLLPGRLTAKSPKKTATRVKAVARG